MKYYLDPTCGVRAFESDGSQDFLITEDMQPLTPEEALAYTKPEPTPEQLQEIINAESRAYLASTDWYVIRMQETGEPVPTEILEARAVARSKVVP